MVRFDAWLAWYPACEKKLLTEKEAREQMDLPEVGHRMALGWKCIPVRVSQIRQKETK